MAELDPVKMAEEAGGIRFSPEQKEMTYPMYEALQKKGTLFVGQGPTGMGKTFVIAAVTKALAESGRRVCIAVPSYAHLEDVMGSHLSRLNIQFVKLRGLSALKKERGEGCPLQEMEIPTPIFCHDGKDAKTGPYSERCSTIDCTVRRELGATKDARVVLTVFHKLIYNSYLLNDFDVIIFDESHGLEDAVRNARLAKIRKRDLETVMQYAEDKAPFTKMIDIIQRIARTGRQEVNPMIVEREFVNPIKQTMPQVELKVWETDESSHRPNSAVTAAYYTLARSVNSIDRMDSYKFVYHDESILGIPSEIIFSRRGGRQAAKETAIALISATIESPKFHARDCGLPFYTLAPPVQIESARLIAERFAKRPIFGLVDGPIMRKDPNFKESYASARNEAN